MIPLSTATIAAQIRLLIDTVTDSNSDSIFRDLCQLAECEPEGCVLLLNACFEQVKPSESQLKRDLLSQVFKYLLEKPSFSSHFCEALKTVTITEKFLEDLSNQLNLSLPEKIGASLALFDSENLELRLRGLNFCIAEIEGFCENPSDSVSNEKIQEIALFILQNDNVSKHIETFTKIISILESKESIFLIPSLDLKNNPYPEGSLRTWEQLVNKSNTGIEKYLSEIERETKSTDILKEFGYSCMASTEHFKFALSLLSPLNDAIISKLIGTMVKSRTGLQDGTGAFSVVLSVYGSGLVCESASLSTWDIAVFVDSVNQMVPNTNWKSVIENLDHEGFFVPDEPAFNFLMSIYTHACQDPFPLEAVFGRIWKNTEGQLSLLKYAVAAAPDIFSFAHGAHLMAFAEVAHLKQGNEAWFSLDLLEVLCQLAELGHSNSVKKIIEFPITHFADVLLLGVSQVKTAYNLIQNEVLSRTFSIILRDTSKLNVISCLWRVNPMMLIRGFIETYIDPNCLTRINTVCNDLKILSVVLDTVPFCFSIRLACVASNKDQFNLEKWLTENLTVYKDIFSEECVKFLKESLSSSESSDPDSDQNTVMNIYKESGSIFLKVLQAQSGQNISEQLSDEINRQLNSLYISSNSNTSSQAGTEETVSEDIEKEANKYFHQMFSGQITTDQMIQMLTRFRDSPADKRENMIFNCMIANLFEEYKFFPKYPDKQLKLAAILFGSLIKHHLVAHLSLGIALRGVLDALRKSVDSKMFVFGTKALEQFMDRLVEWPQYCNHILQISHLRGTHPDLVAAVERTLARVSSSQNNNESTAVPASTETSIEGSEASWQMAGTVPSQLGRQVSSFQMQQQQQQRTAVPAAPQGFPVAGPVQVTVQRSTNQSKPQISSVPQPTVVTDPPAPTVPPKPVVTQSLLASSTSGSSTTGFSRPRNLATGVLRQNSYSSTGFGSALNIETLVAAAERRDTVIETPPPEIQDKILFMINNISTSNMEAKAKDFIDVLPEQYFPWFAQYMVMKRASIEPNFHDLYLKFVDKVNSKALNKEVLKATYENCKVLLRSELIKSSSEERSLLKNLGSWLGKFTIGRNQSLRAKEIDPKALIIEAYERGLMIAVIPFTSKILEPCHSSIAYRPPNPWTMGILSLLVEIYNLPNLKMNLKFDIEVLFKNLSWDMKEVKPASLIKDRPREIEGNPDFSNKDLISTVPQPVPPIVVPDVTSSSMMSAASHVELPPDVSSIATASRPSLPNILNQYAGPIHFSASSMAEEEKLGALIMPEQVSISSSAHVTQPPPSPSPSQFSLAQLMQAIPRADTYFRINPKLAAMVGPQIPLNRIIEAAMEKSVKEIVSPVIQRSVTIASRTTKEIILKDYALEPDDNIISRAAHLMVGTLSGSLAHVTCKEPLRVALTNHLRTLLQNVENNEQIIQTLITDHLDLGCALIESVATRKSVDVIDAEIGQALAQIRKQREAAGSNYYDAYTYAQGPFARVPEALRPKPGQLSHSQIRVYEDFVNVWQTPPPSQNPSPGPTSQGAGASVASASASSVAPSQLLDLPTDDFDRITAQIPTMSANEAPVTRVATPEIISASTESVPVTKDLVVVVPPSPAPVSDRLGTSTPEPLSTGDALERYMHVSQKLEALIAKEGRDAEIQAVVAEVPDIIRRCITRDEAALAMAQKVFRSLYENASNGVHVASYLAVLVAIRDVCKLAVKELTSWVIYSDEEKKFNVDITIGLIRSELLNLGEYNLHLAKLIDAGRNKAATEFAISLVQTLVTQESGVFISELFNVVDVLSKIANRPGSPESLQQLIEIVKNNNNNGSLKEEKARQSRDKKVLSRVKEEGSSSDASLPDPPGFQDQVAVLFTEWCQICDLPVVNDIAYNHFISQLQQNGLLKGDDITERFFRVLTELAVAHSLVNEQVSPSSISSQTHMNNNPPISYFPIDSYCKLSVVILKYASVDQIPNKAIILVKLLSVTARVLQKEAEEKKTSFNPRPYYRIFINWFIDIVSPDSDVANFPVLTCFANAFHALQPLRVPGFSYAWLELISHRNFMPKILTVNSSKGWPYFQRLVVDLFKFLDPFLRSKEIPEPVVFFYKGVLKMLLVLLHDFPEFLCDYHFSFCDVIPTTCIQLRNLILSAFPRNMRLPDPSTPNLKIDLLPEILQPPRILSDVEGALKAKQLKADIDEYLKTRNENSPFLTDLKHKLLLPQNEVTQTGTKYNVPLINSLVLYIGMQAIQQLQSKAGAGGPPQQMSHSPMDIFLVGAAMDVYQSLVKNLDTEGRYYLVNAICNQLRYPNNHTHYFSFVLLYLWAEATTDLIQEQITRVLLERLIVNRPHPWGLLITFIEMIKNPRYGFWNRNFTRAAPDIEKLFESVSRSCGTGPISKALEEGLASSVADVNH